MANYPALENATPPAMTGVERLKAVQERLIARGVKDVKPFFAPDAFTKYTHDEICGHLADLLESHEEGRYTVISSIGDKR